MKTTLLSLKNIFLSFFVVFMMLSSRGSWGQTTVLTEDFTAYSSGGNTASSGVGSPDGTDIYTSSTNVANFPTGTKVYQAGGMAKLGTSSLVGSMTSKIIDLSTDGGNVKVTFDVKGWTTVEGSVKITITGQVAKTVQYIAEMNNSTLDTRFVTFTGGIANSTVKIETTAKRAYIDNVKVETFSDCNAPTNPSGVITGNSSACTSSILSFSGTASSSILNYWQTSTSGTSISNDASSPLNITTGGNYFVRAFDTVANCWSINALGPYAVTINAPINISNQPINATVVAGNNTTFEVDATGVSNYQWQVNTGSGFNNLSNSGAYSNVTSATLNIANATYSMNNYLYRCVLTANSPCSNVNSNSAILFVSLASSSSDYFRSNVLVGNWSTPESWQSSSTGVTGSWITSTLSPTSSAAKIDILNNNKIRIVASGVSMTNTTVQSGGILEVATSSSFNVSGSDEIELTIESGGLFSVKNNGFNSGDAFGLIRTGGIITADLGSDGSTFLKKYIVASSGLFYFENESVCEWNLSNYPSSSGIGELFAPNNVGDLAIFKINNLDPNQAYGNSSNDNVINAILELNTSVPFRINSNPSQKNIYLIGGIRGSGALIQKTSNNPGQIILGDATHIPRLDGNITIEVKSNRLKLPNGAKVTTGSNIVIQRNDGVMENAIIDGQSGIITVDGTLDITNMRIENVLSGGVVVNGVLKTSHSGGLKGNGSAIVNGTLTLNISSTIEYYSIGNQVISSSPNYFNLTLSGASTKTTQGAITIDTNGTVKITGNPVVDATSNIASTNINNTAFKMDGGRLILRTIDAQPNMRGDYNITGGTIEFASSQSTSQNVRNKFYQNIEITGSNVKNGNGLITLNGGGTFSVKPNGIFTISSDAIVGPLGSQIVTVESGAVFRTSDPNGFNGGTGLTTTSVRSDVETITLEIGSSVEYSGADQTITKIKYGNLKISGSGIKTLNADLIEVDKNLDVVSGLLRIEGGKTLKVRNNITTVNTDALFDTATIPSLDPTVGIEIKDSGSLVQINDSSINSGSIKMQRKSKPMLHQDYTYWSSPVYGNNDANLDAGEFSLYSLSPLTSASKFFKWDENIIPLQNWQSLVPTITSMNPGRGYIARAPQSFPVSGNPAEFIANFIGKPNNGIVATPVKGSIPISGDDTTSPNPSTTADNYYWNLIGNPYPSAINATAFVTENSTKIAGTLYFWTHNTPLNVATPLGYSPNDYASWNGTGGVGTAALSEDDENDNVPNGFVAAGQSFFIRGITAGISTVIFNNSMRVDGSGGKNSQFFRTSNDTTQTISTTDKHRVWLNLTGAQNAFNQTLVGYVTDATNDYDLRFDGESFGGNAVTFYSVLNAKNLVIQGRALPFSNLDEVLLGYKTTLTGNLTISIDHLDGLMEEQDIYLEDKVLNVVHDLKASSYSFATTPGTFDTRFVLRYLPEADLSNPTFDDQVSAVRIYKSKGALQVNSPYETIASVAVYDITGRLIFEKENCNTNRFETSDITSSQQALIVKVTLMNGAVVTNKVL